MQSLDAMELNAIRHFAELHTGGCQNPHGGRCSCGWNLIEARIEELRGATPERVAFLRSSVRFVHDDDHERTLEALALLGAVSPADFAVDPIAPERPTEGSTRDA